MLDGLLSGSRFRLLYWSIVVVALGLFVSGALEHGERVNDNRRDKDQSAYLELASRIATSGRIEVDGARPPLYPALLALGFDPALSQEEFFERSKRVNIGITFVLACVLLAVFRRFLSPLAALTAWLAMTFTVLLFYAPYVKAEAPFFVLFTASFMGLADQLFRPRPRVAVGVGLVAGLTELFKEFTLPLLVLFVAVQAVVAGIELVKASRLPKAERRLRFHARRALTIPLVLAAFFAIRAPHLVANARVFGRPFYNVNSAFYLWYDNWGQVERGTKGAGDREGFPIMSADELPSAEKYFRTHSAGDVRRRIEKGFREPCRKSVSSHGFYRYAVIAVVAAALALANRKLRRWLDRNSRLAWFMGLYVAGYLLACSWFHAINGGVRFVVSLVGPLIFVGAWLSDRAPRPVRGTASLWTIATAAALAADIPAALVVWVKTMKSSGW